MSDALVPIDLLEQILDERLEELRSTKRLSEGMMEMFEGWQDSDIQYYRGVAYGLDYALWVLTREEE